MNKRNNLLMGCVFAFSVFVFGIGLGRAQEVEPAEAVRTCGLDGTIQERITDCAKPIDDGGFGHHATRTFDLRNQMDDPIDRYDDYEIISWRLVARTEDKLQFWMNAKTELIWSDVSQYKMMYDKAQSFCDKMTKVFDGSETFRLPILSEFSSAHWEGLFSILSSEKLRSNVWSSTTETSIHSKEYYTISEKFRKSGMYTYVHTEGTPQFVRCISE